MTKPVTLEKEALRVPTIDPGADRACPTLKVADLQRALDFYCGVGFYAHHEPPGCGLHIGGRLSPSPGPKYMGEPWRFAPARGRDRPLPYRNSLPDPKAPR